MLTIHGALSDKAGNIIFKIDGNDADDDGIIRRFCCPVLTVFFCVHGANYRGECVVIIKYIRGALTELAPCFLRCEHYNNHAQQHNALWCQIPAFPPYTGQISSRSLPRKWRWRREGGRQRVLNELWRTRLSCGSYSRPPPLPSASLSLSRLPVCRRSSFLTGEGGGGRGDEPNHRPRGSLVLYKSLNTLWWVGWWGDRKEKTAMRKRFLR
jgi:hypothetical protein